MLSPGSTLVFLYEILQELELVVQVLKLASVHTKNRTQNQIPAYIGGAGFWTQTCKKVTGAGDV